MSTTKTKAMRAGRPARASAKRKTAWWEGRRPAVDFLKARLLKLCDKAERAVKALRRMDLQGEDAPETFGPVMAMLFDATFGCQGVEGALKVRQEARKAALELAMLDDGGDPEAEAFGLGMKMHGEMVRHLTAASKKHMRKARRVA